MEETTITFSQLALTSKILASRLLTIGENRLELLIVEVQEERGRLLHVILLSFGVAAFGLLAGLMLSAALVVLLWARAPMAVLLGLTAFYGTVALCLFRRLRRLQREWKTLASTLDQLRRDRIALENQFT